MAEVMKRLCGQGESSEHLRCPDDLVRFVQRRSNVFRSGFAPALVVVGLTNKWNVTGAFEQSRCFGHGGVGALQLASCALSLHADLIALTWVVPAGAGPPVALEIEAAQVLGRRLAELGVELVDSVIVSGHLRWSCRDIVMSKWEKV